jgi:hypothetical protein
VTPTILVVALVAAAAICFDVYCLVDLRRARVRHLSKWGGRWSSAFRTPGAAWLT